MTPPLKMSRERLAEEARGEIGLAVSRFFDWMTGAEPLEQRLEDELLAGEEGEASTIETIGEEVPAVANGCTPSPEVAARDARPCALCLGAGALERVADGARVPCPACAKGGR